MEKQITNQELLRAINKSFSEIEQKMATKDDLATLESRMVSKDEFRAEIQAIKSVMVTKDELKTEFSKFETRMVSKDYLDDKLFALKGELNTSIKKVDDRVNTVANQISAVANQVGTLVNVLRHKKVISPTSAQQILVVRPFLTEN